MPRKQSQKIDVDKKESLSGLIQETYNDACLQITSAQNAINELKVIKTEDIDDLTKVAKETSGLLKVKDSAIRIKFEIAKLQNEIIKNNGNVNTVVGKLETGSASLDDFAAIREYMKEKAKADSEDDSV